MKQRVFVIGPDLASLVPYGVAFPSSLYDVTLVEARDVTQRALELARGRDAWCLLLGAADDGLPPGLEVVDEVSLDDTDGPLVAVAHLIAAVHWQQPAIETGVANPVEPQYG
jgi:hypothetical protein